MPRVHLLRSLFDRDADRRARDHTGSIIPQIRTHQKANSLQADLLAFHASHFSVSATEHSTKNHLADQVELTAQQPEEEEGEYEEDDGLGYYPDGVKRTLTDEQIAIFRHSEIQALLRKRRHATEANSFLALSAESKEAAEEGECEEGEIAEELDSEKTTKVETMKANNKKERKAQVAKQKGWFRQSVKPDLRKRTWDVVEKGVGVLDYDEGDELGVGSEQRRNVQRRRISYDD